MDSAVRILSRREHAAEEIRQKLTQRGFPANDIEAAIRRLHELDLLSDARFVEAYLRTAARKYGDTRLRQELEERKVEKSLIDGALDRLAKERPETERIRRLLGGKCPTAETSDAMRRRLSARGFSAAAIIAVLKESPNEEET